MRTARDLDGLQALGSENHQPSQSRAVPPYAKHSYPISVIDMQGAVTHIDAAVSAATGVTMRSQGHGGF